ncbi:hypothetical protein [Marinobacter oulmenensis]|uniref:Uncharacterized protein n=1 Tax=Marinobacter oulmenensis TaxID=643747 RepID=A0A840UKC5_9GAMM|nr:hypothetical protein [Marinobacter oulmenensis]MBB5321188.1 hypothetical protein [Marinobacter oulmenensis]
MRLDLPNSTRVIDLIRLANAQGKRLVWKRDGLRYRPHMEAANDQHPVVTRLRPRLRVVDSKKP